MRLVDTLLGGLAGEVLAEAPRQGCCLRRMGVPRQAAVPCALSGAVSWREVSAPCQQAGLHRYLHPSQACHQDVCGRTYLGIRCSDLPAWRHPPLPRA